MADIAVAYALMLAEAIGLVAQFPVSVQEYWLGLQGRDAYQRALAAQEFAARAQGVSTLAASSAAPTQISPVLSGKGNKSL